MFKCKGRFHMLKKFLFIFCVLFLPHASFSQETNALFPELGQAQKKPTVQPEVNLDLADSGIPQAPDTLEPQTEENLTQSLNEGSLKQEAKENKGNDTFEIYAHDYEIIVPLDERVQFCKTSITLLNKTKYHLKHLELKIDYNGVSVPYHFSNIAPGLTATGPLFLAGYACQGLLRIADLDISECSAEGLTQDECKERVKYVQK